MNWQTILSALLPIILSNLPSLFKTTPPAAGSQSDTVTKFIELVQTALNAAQGAGYLNFGQPLVVDGHVGPKTLAAMQALMTKFGLPV